MIQRLSDKQKPCTYCTRYGHTAWKCPRKAMTTMKTTGFRVHCQYCDSDKHTKGSCPDRPSHKTLATIDPKTKRYPDVSLRKSGKYGQKWAITRARWVKENPADHAGYWYCHYCSKALTADELTVDHKLGRGRHPELRFEVSNLVACCSQDNTTKGSLDHDEYCKRCDINTIE